MTAPLQYGTASPTDPTAVMGRRTLAWLADLLLYAAVVAAGFASMAEYTEIPPGIPEAEACDVFEQQNPGAADACIAYDGDVYLLDGGEAGVQTLLSVGWFALFVILQGVTGGSPGKLLFGLRVVDQQGRRCGIGRSLGRTLLWVVDAAPWLIPLVGPITAFTSTGHRRVGDLAAGTYVVSASSMGAPVAPPGVAQPTASAWGAPPPVGQGPWAPPAAPPSGPPTERPPTLTPGESGRWTSPIAPPTPDLDIRDLEVPHPTERADQAPPEVSADPDWSRTPDLGVTPPPGTGEGSSEGPEPPEWSAPTLPEVEEPATDWTPPTGPEAEPTPMLAPEPEPEPEPAPEPTPEPAPEPPAAPDVSASSEPAPFAPPGAQPSPSIEPESAPAVEQAWPAPQWDQARGTYLQWDPNRQAWLQWDAAQYRWKSIDT